VLDDVRTKSPWTVAVYARVGYDRKKLKYLVPGGITSAYNVAVYFAGTYGSSSKDQYRLPNANELVVGAGLNSTWLKQSTDSFSQFREVNKFHMTCLKLFNLYHENVTKTLVFETIDHWYLVLFQVVSVEPYQGPLAATQRFTIVLLQLREPFQFSPYVRPACYIDSVPNHQDAYEFLRIAYPSEVTSSVLTGFTHPIESGSSQLVRLRIKGESREFCNKVYLDQYDSKMPSGFSCAKAVYKGKIISRCH